MQIQVRPPKVKTPNGYAYEPIELPRTRRRPDPWIVILAVLAIVASTVAVGLGIAWHDRGAELTTARNDIATLQTQVDILGHRLDAVRARVQDLTGRRGALVDRLDEAKALAARRGERVQNLRAEIVGLQATLAGLHACSAAGMTVPELPAGLPDAVRETAQAILGAATTCDLAYLGRLGTDSTEFPFEYGLDAVQPPARYWLREEFEGQGPMSHLVGLFSLPMATRVAPDGVTEYVWPSAAARGPWSQVPVTEREAVRAWYTAEGLEVPIYDGTYWGWRVWIGADGSWRGFVTSPD